MATLPFQLLEFVLAPPAVGPGPHTSEWASWRRDSAAGDPEDPIVAVTTEDRRITVDPAEARAKLRAAGKKLKHAPKSAWEGPRAWS